MAKVSLRLVAYSLQHPKGSLYNQILTHPDSIGTKRQDGVNIIS